MFPLRLGSLYGVFDLAVVALLAGSICFESGKTHIWIVHTTLNVCCNLIFLPDGRFLLRSVFCGTYDMLCPACTVVLNIIVRMYASLLMFFTRGSVVSV